MIEGRLDQREIFIAVFGMIEAAIATTPSARAMVDAVAGHMAQEPAQAGGHAPRRLPVCDHVPQALRAARAGGPQAARMAEVFAALEPHLAWGLRAGAVEQGDAFLRGHANALIFGHGDFSKPEKVTLGVSLMAPGVSYPDHAHPPEELYIVLSSGRWRQNRGPWVQRGAGALVHNPPGINHGMQSESSPLLALWLLWNG